MSKIKCFKISSGEEIMGKVESDEGTQINLTDVATIVMVPSQSMQGQVGLALMPFLPYSDDKALTLHRNFVMFEFDPSVDMINNYNRQFGSGIQIAQSM